MTALDRSWAPPHHASGPLQKKQRDSERPEFLRFGNDSQAHYGVPMSDREISVLLACPRELTVKDHEAFAHALGQLRLKLLRVIQSLPGYEDQKHVAPDVRVYQPGTYANYGAGNLESKQAKKQDGYAVSLQFGGHRFELEFPSSNRDTRTTQRALNRLLEEIQQAVGTSLNRGNRPTPATTNTAKLASV